MVIMTEITHGTERDTRSSCSSCLGTQKLGESPEDLLRGIAAQETPLGSEQLHCSKPQAAELQDTAVLRSLQLSCMLCAVVWNIPGPQSQVMQGQNQEIFLHLLLLTVSGAGPHFKAMLRDYPR